MKSLATAIAIICAVTPLSAQQSGHPLDPLSWQEYWTVLQVLDDAGHLADSTVFTHVQLLDPPKDQVFAWMKGGPLKRSALAVVRQGPDVYEAVVDVMMGTLVSYQRKDGVQGMWVNSDYVAMNDVLAKNADFMAALKKRGYNDLKLISCFAIPPGYFGTEQEMGRRLAHVLCEDPRGVRNTWPRGISGLDAVVDMNTREVVKVVDEDVVPMTTANADYDRATIGSARDVPGPILISQPLGHGFQIDGYQVSWQKWSFHVRPDPRVGDVISLVTYDDGGDKRSVLYEGSLSEIFVPYMDPTFGWFSRNFIDAGEFSAGGLAKPLMEGIDCPDHAVYIDQLVPGENGRPIQKPRAICLYERETGDMAWRHVEADSPVGAEGRKKRDLVVRQGVVLGNYDYMFDWIFQQDGSIRVAVGATGIAESKVVAQESAAIAQAGSNGSNGSDGGENTPADAYGHFVDKQVVAVNHDHYFNFRLDFDVDGSTNSLEIDRLVSKELPADHLRRSIWVPEATIAKRESDAKLRINLSHPALWRVVSEKRRNHVGYRTSYQLLPAANTNTLLSDDDYPRRRAGFIDYHLWATPYDPAEHYAAGDYPTLSTPGQGLPAYTANDRSIEDTDIVLWYTVGMHHLVRAEDWPQMPVLWHSFDIRPFDFFDRNPAMDLPH